MPKKPRVEFYLKARRSKFCVAVLLCEENDGKLIIINSSCLKDSFGFSFGKEIQSIINRIYYDATT